MSNLVPAQQGNQCVWDPMQEVLKRTCTVTQSVRIIRWFAVLSRIIASEVSPSDFHIEYRFNGAENTDDRVYCDLDGTVGAQVREFEGWIRRILIPWRPSRVAREAGGLMEVAAVRRAMSKLEVLAGCCSLQGTEP